MRFRGCTDPVTRLILPADLFVKSIDQLLACNDSPTGKAVLFEHPLQTVLEAIYELKPVLLKHGLKLFLFLMPFLLEHA